jgi:hypothetical protein
MTISKWGLEWWRAPRVIRDFGCVRVVDNGRSPMDGDDIIVQVRAGDGWRDLAGFNSLSDDYAFTNARETAERFVKQQTRPGA